MCLCVIGTRIFYEEERVLQNLRIISSHENHEKKRGEWAMTLKKM